MTRSKDGLKGAGEWYQMKLLFPNLEGATVLDLGCGYGWHCRYAIEQGAAYVFGLDGSEKMIARAQHQNAHPNIEYRVCALDGYDYPQNRFDFVLSNLALPYVDDLDNIFAKVYRTLKADGIFVFNIEHPVFTAGVGQDWIYNEKHEPLYWAIDDYFYPGKRKTDFLGCEVIKVHHTLSQILNGLLKTGFRLLAVDEAVPSKEMMKREGIKDEMRRPMMLMVKATKRA